MRAMAFMLMLLPSVVFAQPNILVILADDLGKEGLSFYGDAVHSTPSLDRLAEEGVVYTKAYAMPVCSPSRAALLTGLYPRNNGVRRVIEDGDSKCLDPALPSLARTLSNAGYTTAAAGKWHLCGTFLDKPWHPLDMGFGHYALLGKHAGKYFNPLVTYGQQGVVETAQETTFSPDLFANWVQDFMQSTQEPWFVYWALNLVHTRMIDPWMVEPGTTQNYTDMTSYMDKLIGETVPENTIVVFLGDNGTAKIVGGDKTTAKEGGVNVPMIVWGLGQGMDHRLVSLTDFHATLAELAGVPAPVTDGQSFLTTERDHVISHAVTSAGVRRMVSDGRWKLRGKPWELYDLSSDLTESSPVNRSAIEQRLLTHWRDH